MNAARRIAAALAVVLLGARGACQDVRTWPYPQAAIDAFAALPVQDGGRIKPLDSLARFALLRLAERRSAAVPDEPRYGAIAGTRLDPTEWVMDVMLYPEQADAYPVFLVTDSEVLDLIGLSDVARSKRDRYTFAELRPGLDALELRARTYFHTAEKDRTRIQNQLVYLHQDLADYQGIRRAFEAARARLPLPAEVGALRAAFGAATEVRFSDAMRTARDLLAAYRASSASPDDAGRAELAALDAFLTRPVELARDSSELSWLPPADDRTEAWLDLEGVFVEVARDGPTGHAAQIEAMRLLESVVDSRDDPTALAAAAARWSEHVRGMARARGEGEKLESEVAFYRHDQFWRAQWSFVLAFALALLALLAPRSRLLYRAAWIPAAVGAGLLVWGVAERCILRERPPVSTLYETILFVTAGIVVTALALEAVVAALRVTTAKRVALGVAALLGAFGTFLAARHEAFKGEDTMPQLQAVLDTNFWLSTHVTTVTLGYMAGLLAGFLGHVYLLGRLFGWRRGRADERATYRWIGRMVYASLCFALLLSTVGTILGGVWANDSWGRFWGWDPKENGALMIVLWNLLILHGRFGGFWRDHGTAVLAVFGNVIVAFSWWGVNLMGVGLHSYGFQSGLKFWVTTFYVSQLLVVLLGLLAARRKDARAQRSHKEDPPAGVAGPDVSET